MKAVRDLAKLDVDDHNDRIAAIKKEAKAKKKMKLILSKPTWSLQLYQRNRRLK